MKNFDVKTSYSVYKECYLKVGRYASDNSIAVEIWNRCDGPISRITTCLCDRSLTTDWAYVDTNNCPWAVELLEQMGLAKRTGRTRQSGYCSYPAMRFDRSKMKEYEEEKKLESYAEMRTRQQREFNGLPLGFAFSNEQFDEMMRKWGLDPDKDLDKIYRIPGGGFIQKKDHAQLHEMLDRHEAEMEEAKNADADGTGFLYQMFLYELENHEYGYTGDLEDTLDSLGMTMDEVLKSPRLTRALDKASDEIREREGC